MANGVVTILADDIEAEEALGFYLSDIKTPAFAQSAFSMSAKMT